MFGRSTRACSKAHHGKALSERPLPRHVLRVLLVRTWGHICGVRWLWLAQHTHASGLVAIPCDIAELKRCATTLKGNLQSRYTHTHTRTHTHTHAQQTNRYNPHGARRKEVNGTTNNPQRHAGTGTVGMCGVCDTVCGVVSANLQLSRRR